MSAAGLRFSHPLVTAKLAELGVTGEDPPASPAWRQFVEWVGSLYREVEELRALHRDAVLDRSSFEHLFHHSPVPTMQQDYSRLERWMEGVGRRAPTTWSRRSAGQSSSASAPWCR